MKLVILGGFIVIWASNWGRLFTFEMSPWPSWGDSHCLPAYGLSCFEILPALFSCILLVAVLGLFLQAGDPCWCWWLPTLACLSVLFLFTSYVQLIVTMGPSPYYPRGVNSYLTALGLLGYPSVFERKSPWPWRMVFVTCSWIFLSEYFYIYVYQRDWNIIFWSFVLFICCWYQSNSISFLKLHSV